MRRTLLLALALVGVVAADAACPIGECACSVCLVGQAVTLTVTDADGTPLSDWVVEATVDGQPVVDIAGCAPENRTTNTCSLGSEVGVYHLVIRAPGFEDKEAAARVSIPAGQDCCVNPCVPNVLLSVSMIPEET